MATKTNGSVLIIWNDTERSFSFEKWNNNLLREDAVVNCWPIDMQKGVDGLPQHSCGRSQIVEFVNHLSAADAVGDGHDVVRLRANWAFFFRTS